MTGETDTTPVGALGPIKMWSIIVGGLVGLILPVLCKIFPNKAKWISSPAGIGLAWVSHWFYALLFFTGAVIGQIIQRRHAKWATLFLFPVAAGMIAGESLMGVVLVMWENGLDMIRAIFGLGGVSRRYRSVPLYSALIRPHEDGRSWNASLGPIPKVGVPTMKPQ